ncbi:3-dehydroquinate synthase [Striga asiatica]|uniref:3-dehydroquinate synthase n=1 Tax=Striga asiatica TaxID=4170 RepID=A0A5A7QZD5_STRAF|nr:3-dehydroquinate synthase [Striga asiatica]
MKKPDNSLLLCVFFLLCLCSAWSLRKTSYDHFQLVHTWPNTFCLDRNITCKKPVPQNFVIHGLWPADKSGKPLTHCYKTGSICSDISKYKRQLAHSWPSIRADLTNANFWQYQWDKHGSCALSRMTVHDYLQLITTTQRKLDLLRALTSNNIKPNNGSLLYTVKAIEAAVKREIGARHFYVSCRVLKGRVFLREIYICLDGNGKKIVSCPIRYHQTGCGKDKNLVFPASDASRMQIGGLQIDPSVNSGEEEDPISTRTLFGKINARAGGCFCKFSEKESLDMDGKEGGDDGRRGKRLEYFCLSLRPPRTRRRLIYEISWNSIALLYPLFIEEGGLFDSERIKIASFFEISSPEQLEKLEPLNKQAENVVVNLLDWRAIPAENIVAAIQASRKTVFAVSKTSSEAQMFLEALEHGLDGVVLKTEDIESIIQLKHYLDKRDDEGSLLEVTKAVVTNIQTVGMGDRVCVDLCSIMKPGEGLLVGSFARGLFLVHSECLESNYISSRPFRVNAGPVHAYVAVPGGKTNYLSELKAGKNVLIVDQNGKQRTAIIGRVKIETRPLILVEAKIDDDSQTSYSILLQNAETVALVSLEGAIPVTSLKISDEILLRAQGGARHTGIEIEEFIVEK